MASMRSYLLVWVNNRRRGKITGKRAKWVLPKKNPKNIKTKKKLETMSKMYNKWRADYHSSPPMDAEKNQHQQRGSPVWNDWAWWHWTSCATAALRGLLRRDDLKKLGETEAGRSVSRDTTQRCVQEMGCKCRNPSVKPLMNQGRHLKCLTRAKKKNNRTAAQSFISSWK